ncbi:MAG: CHASE3 domain-containing protein, partial [bacterium]
MINTSAFQGMADTIVTEQSVERLKMHNLSIKHKIWAGFGVLVILLLVNAAISTKNLFKTDETVKNVIEVAQPMVLKAHQFNGLLSRSFSALTNYLLTKKTVDKENYLNALTAAQNELTQLK